MPLHASTLLKLKRFNTPTVFNGWEQITTHLPTTCFNMVETTDFMPEMGPMAGYAVTVVFEPSNPAHPKEHPEAWGEYLRYVASVPGPKIVVVQDLDNPHTYGAFWGEVNSNTHRALGCVGTITDGAVRDLDEMKSAGFKAIARRLSVGHAYSCPVRWGCPVEVFGTEVRPGQLIHADKHGFLVVPAEDESALLEATAFMDNNECDSVLPPVVYPAGNPVDEILAQRAAGSQQFSEAVRQKYGAEGEWK